MDIYYLTTCVGKELRCGSTGSTDLGLQVKDAIKELARAVVVLRSAAGDLPSGPSQAAFGKPSVFSMHCLETSVPCQVGFSQHNSCFSLEQGIRGHE